MTSLQSIEDKIRELRQREKAIAERYDYRSNDLKKQRGLFEKHIQTELEVLVSNDGKYEARNRRFLQEIKNHADKFNSNLKKVLEADGKLHDQLGVVQKVLTADRSKEIEQKLEEIKRQKAAGEEQPEPKKPEQPSPEETFKLLLQKEKEVEYLRERMKLQAGRVGGDESTSVGNFVDQPQGGGASGGLQENKNSRKTPAPKEDIKIDQLIPPFSTVMFDSFKEKKQPPASLGETVGSNIQGTMTISKIPGVESRRIDNSQGKKKVDLFDIPISESNVLGEPAHKGANMKNFMDVSKPVGQSTYGQQKPPSSMTETSPVILAQPPTVNMQSSGGLENPNMKETLPPRLMEEQIGGKQSLRNLQDFQKPPAAMVETKSLYMSDSKSRLEENSSQELAKPSQKASLPAGSTNLPSLPGITKFKKYEDEMPNSAIKEATEDQERPKSSPMVKKEPNLHKTLEAKDDDAGGIMNFLKPSQNWSSNPSNQTSSKLIQPQPVSSNIQKPVTKPTTTQVPTKPPKEEIFEEIEEIDLP